MGEVNGAAGFEVEMSPQTEYQRHILHLSLMVDEGSLSALNTNRRRARSLCPQHIRCLLSRPY